MSGEAPNGSRTEDHVNRIAPLAPVVTVWTRPAGVAAPDTLLPPFVCPWPVASSGLESMIGAEDVTDALAEIGADAEDGAAPMPESVADAEDIAAAMPGSVADAEDTVVEREAHDAPAHADGVPFSADGSPSEEPAPVSTGVTVAVPPPTAPIREAAIHDVAHRLERLAERLRQEGLLAVPRTVGEGDRFDALLVGIVTGYLAADRD